MDDLYWYGRFGYPSASQRDETFAAFAALAGEHRDELVAASTSQYPDVPAGLTSGVEVDGLPGFWFLYRMTDAFSRSDAYLALATLAGETAETGGESTGAWVD